MQSQCTDGLNLGTILSKEKIERFSWQDIGKGNAKWWTDWIHKLSLFESSLGETIIVIITIVDLVNSKLCQLQSSFTPFLDTRSGVELSSLLTTTTTKFVSKSYHQKFQHKVKDVIDILNARRTIKERYFGRKKLFQHFWLNRHRTKKEAISPTNGATGWPLARDPSL